MSASLPGMRRFRFIEDRADLSGDWLVTLVYCAITFSIFYAVASGAHGLSNAIISGGFAALGVGLLMRTMYRALNRAKFGKVHLYLPPEKPPLGCELSGSIVLPVQVAELHRVCIELRCIQVVSGTDSQGKRTLSKERQWYRERYFPVRRSGTGGQVDFRMNLPDEPVISRRQSYIWELQVRAELPGVDLLRTFNFDVDQRRAAPSTPVQPVAAPAQGGNTPAQALAAQHQARAQARAAAPSVTPSAAPRVTPMPAAVPVGTRSTTAAPAISTSVTAAASRPQAEITAKPESAMPIVALIAANLVPLAGVLFLGWKVGEVVLLYWLENVIIGLMNVARIGTAEPEALTTNAPPGKELRPHELRTAKIRSGAIFLVHYGMFCVGHGAFLAFLFPVKGPDGRLLEIEGVMLHMLAEPGMVVAVLALVASHLISFFRNYLGRGEYRRADMARLMTQPYGRIVVVHLYILAGGMLLSSGGSPLPGMELFVIIKTAVDLYMHRRERAVMGN